MKGGIFNKSKLTTIRCRFCHEFLIDGEKSPEQADNTVDDIKHRICGICWNEINKIFIIASFIDKERKPHEHTTSKSIDANDLR